MSIPEANLLKTARQRVQWSQRDLARRLAVTPAYIALLEKAVRTPSPDLWDRVVALFSTDARSADLFAVYKKNQIGPSITNTQDGAGQIGYMPAPEFPVASPPDSLWFTHIPFTIVAGQAGSGKSTFLRAWLQDIKATGGRHIFWRSLSTFGNDPGQLYAELMHFSKSGSESLPEKLERPAEVSAVPPAALAQEVANRLEDHERFSAVLCFDDWQPHGGDTHDFVQFLAANLKKTPVLAATNTPRPHVPGATILPVPQPDDGSWARWCEMWHVPQQVTSQLLRQIHYNPLAAVYLRGAVFSVASITPDCDVAELWMNIVHRVPTQPDVPWDAILHICRDLLGATAMRVLRLVATSPAPIPSQWIGKEAASSVVSRLQQYKFLNATSSSLGPFVAVHEVLHKHAGQLGDESAIPVIEDTTLSTFGDLFIELLIKSHRFEEAAHGMEQLAQRWLRQTAPSAHLIEWMRRLPDKIVQQHPNLQLALARALTLRAQSTDLHQALNLLISLLKRSTLDSGIQWQAIRQVIDISIRQQDYVTAERWLGQASRLMQSAPGSYNEAPVRVLAARIAWEQGNFQGALKALEEVSVEGGADAARFASWKARSTASLGDIAAAAKAARQGLEIARREHIHRAEAFNAILLAEYELFRGNFTQTRRLAERAYDLAKIGDDSNLESQAFRVQAELAVAELRISEAEAALASAKNAVTRRADDTWNHVYILLSQARAAQAKPDWINLLSFARFLEDEANILQSRAQHHPLTGALGVEAAWCWAKANYIHEARRVLAKIDLARCEWRSRWDAQRLELVTEVLEETIFHSKAQQLIQEAQQAGCPYLATICGLTAASQSWQRGFNELAGSYANWTLHAAKSRGWTTLALMAEAIQPSTTEKLSAPPGKIVVHRDGTRAIIAPHRGQKQARRDIGLPLSDPVEE